MKPIALVTAQAARSLDEDLPPLAQALTDAGVDYEIVCWDDADADWSRFGVTVVRSAWDYVPRLQEFLAWAERVSAQTRLLNPLPLIRWNTDKHYLAELAAAGIPTVPTHFVAPDAEPLPALQAFLAAFPQTAECVVKPTVSAGSREIGRAHV